MESLLNLEKEIIEGEENARNTKELYQLLTTYNAYNILLLKINREYNNIIANDKKIYLEDNCYKKKIKDLFSLFNEDEYLICKSLLERYNYNRDMLFLIDENTLLKMHYYGLENTCHPGLCVIDYKLMKIKNCKVKSYEESVYCGEPYYCDYSSEKRDVFGLFEQDNLITPSYLFDEQFKKYNNMDIREILRVQSLDEIQQKISEAKNEKVKRLVLSK